MTHNEDIWDLAASRREEIERLKKEVEQLNNALTTSRGETRQLALEICNNCPSQETKNTPCKDMSISCGLVRDALNRTTSMQINCECGRAHQSKEGWEAQGMFEDLPGGYMVHHNLDEPCQVVGDELDKLKSDLDTHDTELGHMSNALGACRLALDGKPIPEMTDYMEIPQAIAALKNDCVRYRVALKEIKDFEEAHYRHFGVIHNIVTIALAGKKEDDRPFCSYDRESVHLYCGSTDDMTPEEAIKLSADLADVALQCARQKHRAEVLALTEKDKK